MESDGVLRKKGASGLGKFMAEDFAMCLALSVNFGFLAYKSRDVVPAPFFAGVAVSLFALLSLAFARRRFCSTHFARFVSCAAIAGSAVAAFMAPEWNFGRLAPGRLLDEYEAVFFLAASMFLAAFAAALRFCSHRSCKRLFDRLFEVFPKNRTNVWKVSFAMVAVSAAVSACLFLFGGYARGLATLCGICVLACVDLFFLARNPLTFRERKRLDVYFAEKARTDANETILRNIRGRIARRWIDDYRLPLVENLIMFAVRVFFPLRITGAKNIREASGPAVFVSNHGTMIGPVCGVTYLPVVHRPYVHHKMCDAEESARRMWKWTFRKVFRNMSDEKGVRLSLFVAKRTAKWINSYEPVKSFVDLGDARKSMESLLDGVAALLDGDSVLIFPEDSDKAEGGNYKSGEAGEFFSGFAHIGKLYNQRTGRDLYFYPVFVNKRNMTYNIAEPVVYNSGANVTQEKKRVADELRRRMNSLA